MALSFNVLYNYKDKTVKNWLIAQVYYDTKSIKLFDKFEGYKSEIAYKRMLIINKFDPYKINYYYREGNKLKIKSTFYYDLVLERVTQNNKNADCCYELTFTDFKKDNCHIDYFENQYLPRVLSEEKCKKYSGTKAIFKLLNPIKMNAQNTHNRTGYGDEWHWDTDGGLIEHIEGTKYGETTEYYITGIIIR